MKSIVTVPSSGRCWTRASAVSTSSRLFWSSTYSNPSDGRITIAATMNTTRIVTSVGSGAAACDTFSVVGNMYGHCATPQPITIDATAPMASTRAKRCELRSSSTSEPMPQIAEMITSGSARDVSPSKM